ncbi:hypothetical protein BFW01_g9858 [Lasiodiplodia theobromae]|uniref:Mucin-2-like n=1 Tax=Lasiodiplodia theobromae TaxID=45133 RepID=UPI0015C2F24A|nr:Mucin-2-like [Lasiodiplodia theobromae]KAF4535082.1 Mucin-2-like [Lasiodiplodia theobromae]KAF9638961.1 hypothetical protein BFW01_g9858 [Lasiodiplodia theobromae]
MSNPLSWTPSRNQDLSYEDGLALIDDFYENSNRDAPPATTMPPPISPLDADSIKTTGCARATDEDRSAAVISQLPHSPVDRYTPNAHPPLPSSPPQPDQPEWQSHWNFLPPAFTSSPNVTNAPPPTPTTGFTISTQSAPIPVASHIKSSPSPQPSRGTSPNTFVREDNSSTLTTSKAGSPSLATSKNTSPDLPAQKIDSPISTATPVVRKTPIPLPPMPSMETKAPTLVPLLSARTSSVAKENKAPSNKALKKTATDSPSSASATPRTVKKQRCVRCVKQHGACDLDTKHPCSRCAKANVAPEECVPREYGKRRQSQPAA